MSLKELTKEVHKQAERQDFVHELMSGKMSDEMYAKFLWNQHAIYNLLEACAMANSLFNDFPTVRREHLRYWQTSKNFGKSLKILH